MVTWRARARLRRAAAAHLHQQPPRGNVNSVFHNSSFSKENVDLRVCLLVKYSDILKAQGVSGSRGHHVELVVCVSGPI